MLTVKKLQSIKPGAERREIPDGVVPGLVLVIQPSGSRSWALRYRINGRQAKLTFPGVLNLAEARQSARDALASVHKGEDPAATKREAEGNCFDAIVREFIDRSARHKRSGKETERIFRVYVTPRLRRKQIAEVTKRDIIRIVDDLIDAGTPAMAKQVQIQISRLMNWCVSRDILAVSPATGVKAPANEVRDRVLADSEIRHLWLACEKVGHPFGPLTRLLLLTGMRLREVAEAEWSEIDLDAGLWVIPRHRSKNDVEHTVPLGKQAIEILQSLPVIDDAPYLFTTNGRRPVSGFSRAKRQIDTAMGEIAGQAIAPWRTHDIRRTVASNLARLGVGLPTIEKILGHVGVSFRGIVQVYQKYSFSDEKRRALDSWASFLDGIVTDSPPKNVVPLHQAAR